MYCCVKKCQNSIIRKKLLKNRVSFHGFPSKSELREKWLKAIGRPNWKPPAHAGVCSNHFNDDQIKKVQQRYRLVEDAYPVKALPTTAKFDASDIDACRICLISEVKMFSLQNKSLAACVRSIVGLSTDDESMPKYVCFECANYLLKSYKLCQKSAAAQEVLINIFREHSEVTKNLVKNVDRSNLNLTTNLTFNKVVPKTIIDVKYDEDLKLYISEQITKENILDKTDIDDKINIVKIFDEPELFDEMKIEEQNKEPNVLKKKRLKESFELQEFKAEDDGSDEDNMALANFVGVSNQNDVKNDDGFESDVSDDFDVDNYDSKAIDENNDVDFRNERKHKRKSAARKNFEALTAEELEMQSSFDIVILSLQEQIEDRQKLRHSAAYRDGLYKCEVCFKTYLHPDAFKIHLEHHDPSRGEAECPVCKVRYKNETLARSHAARTHGRKYCCKTCPKVFNNVRIAKKHQKRHEGYLYKCSFCDFTTIHESAHGAHVRTVHSARHECACGERFASKRALLSHAARTLHQITEDHSSSDIAKEEDNLKTDQKAQPQDTYIKEKRVASAPTSSKVSSSEDQVKTETKPTRVYRTNLTADQYPHRCEHCGETVNNRKEHYFHVRKSHPKQRESYQPLITAVCDTCGKGFQLVLERKLPNEKVLEKDFQSHLQVIALPTDMYLNRCRKCMYFACKN